MKPRKIKRLRLKLGLTQEKFASKLGVTFVTVNRWEAGKAMPSSLALRQLTELRKNNEKTFSRPERSTGGERR